MPVAAPSWSWTTRNVSRHCQVWKFALGAKWSLIENHNALKEKYVLRDSSRENKMDLGRERPSEERACVGQLSVTVTKCLRYYLKKRKDLFWFTVSEASVHG